MRRVIDDRYFDEISKAITDVINKIPAEKVSKYDYGMYRSDRHMIMQYILTNVPDIMFGKSMNTTGIGNNGCYEIICTKDKTEEQICGLIHLTDDMYGGTICWVSDYDNFRKMSHRTIKGRK